jgi:hypothetical protein
VHIIIIIVEVKYPKAGNDSVTKNLHPAAKIFTGGLYFSWDSGISNPESGLPFTI